MKVTSNLTAESFTATALSVQVLENVLVITEKHTATVAMATILLEVWAISHVTNVKEEVMEKLPMTVYSHDSFLKP